MARTSNDTTLARPTYASAPSAPAPSASAPSASAAAEHAASMPESGEQATAKSAAVALPADRNQAAKPAQPAEPYLIYDSVLPSSIPWGHQIATYSDGPFRVSPAAVASRGDVLWIDVNGSNTSANALDVEPGDATPAGAAAWVSAKLTQDPGSNAILYTSRSDWGQVINDVDALPAWMHSHVKYWIADPTGSPHILPGSSATQWYWGPAYDISLAEPGFSS
jgi:hypothetical protein